MTPAPRPHRLMPVSKPPILQRIAADSARRAANLRAASELYAPAPKPEAPAPFYVNVYQLSPGRHFLGAASAGPIYSQHAVYRLRITLKVAA